MGKLIIFDSTNFYCLLICATLITLFGCSNSNNTTASDGGATSPNTNFIELKKPLGSYKVGTRSFIWTDASREEVATSEPEDRRTLYVQIWYPAKGSQATNPIPYLGTEETIEKFAALESETWMNRFRRVKTNAFENADMPDEASSYPVVIFSPGFGMSKYFYTILFEELASQGFVVAAMDHLYLNPLIDRQGAAIDPNGGYWHTFPLSGAAASMQDAVTKLEHANSNFAADHLFALSKLKDLNSTDAKFKGRLDINKVASVGHSAGATAPLALMSDEESPFAAYLVYDVNVHDVVGGENIVIPINIRTQSPVQLIVLEYAFAPPNEFLGSLNTDIHISRLTNMSHIELADVAYIRSIDVRDEQRRQQALSNLDKILEITVSFLKHTLY